MFFQCIVIFGNFKTSLFSISQINSDIGGYTGYPHIVTRSKELLLRWAEYSAFTPMMRTHEGNQPEANHQIYSDNDTMKQFARLTNIFVELKDIRKEAVEQYYKNGNNQLYEAPV